MIFSNAILAAAALFMGSAALFMGSAQADATIQIAGYYADSNVEAYLKRDLVQYNFERALSDNDGPLDATCEAMEDALDFWNSDDPDEGAYLRSIPTYTGTESDEWGEFTSYYGSKQFHIQWVDKAFQQGLNPGTNLGLAPLGAGNGKADFYAAFVNKIGAFPNLYESGVWVSGRKNCVGFEESIKKATSYVFQFGEIMQLLQAAYDSVNSGCIGSKETGACFNAVQKWDAAVATFVGSMEGNGADGLDGGPTGVSLFSLAEKRCANMATCGVTADGNDQKEVASINFTIMRLFAAGRQATFQGEKAQMKVLQRLISNKLAVGNIQGTIRYAWRLSGQGGTPNTLALTPGVDAPGFFDNTPPDKEVGEMGTFAITVLPKLWACSRNAEKLVYAEIAIGGPKTVTYVANSSFTRPSVNFDTLKLALECNYKCLGITCEEVGSLFDKQTVNGYGNGATGAPLARSVTCNDGKMGTVLPNSSCKRQRGAEKKVCKPFIKRPGVTGRDKLEFYYNSIGTRKSL